MAIGSDVGNKPVTATGTTYCTVAQVYTYLQKPEPSAANDEGELTPAKVESLIRDMEGEIDSITGTSWRARQVRLEYHDFTTMRDEEYWVLLELRHKPVKTLSAASGDALEVRDGGSWTDWLATKTQGINGEFWIQEPDGFLRLRRGVCERTREARVRLSYRYGEVDVPEEIRQACAKLAAAEIASGDVIGVGGQGGGVDHVQLEPRVRLWRNAAYAILARYQGVGRGY